MKNSNLIFLFVALFISACSKDTGTEPAEVMQPAEGLEVKLVVASGWCGTEKTVVMNSKQTHRDLRSDVCTRSSVNTIKQTDESRFNRLSSFLQDLDLFDREYRECSRCRDGVDYILTINDGARVVEQSIGFDNKEKGIPAFIAFLKEL